MHLLGTGAAYTPPTLSCIASYISTVYLFQVSRHTALRVWEIKRCQRSLHAQTNPPPSQPSCLVASPLPQNDGSYTEATSRWPLHSLLCISCSPTSCQVRLHSFHCQMRCLSKVIVQYSADLQSQQCGAKKTNCASPWQDYRVQLSITFFSGVFHASSHCEST